MTIDTSEGHPAMDYDEHVRTFEGFWLFTKISVILTVLALIGLAFFLL